MTQHRVLLVRPWDSARQGAGCCAGGSGGLCGLGRHEDPEEARNRASRQPLAAVYRAVRAGLPDQVAVEIVDPHNTLFLLPAILRDALRHGLGWRAALRALVRGSAYAAIVVDGQVVSSGELPAPERALGRIRQALAS